MWFGAVLMVPVILAGIAFMPFNPITAGSDLLVVPSLTPLAADALISQELDVTPKTLGAAMTDSNKAWDKIEFNSRTLFNNVWGLAVDEKLNSGIFTHQDKSFGWHWNRPEPGIKPGQTNIQPIFPNIRIGGNPWERSNNTSFPIKLSDLKSLTLEVAYNYSSNPIGSYNLAYDMFFTDLSEPSANPKPKAEVMIWLHSTNQQPDKSYKGDFSDGSNTFRLYSWKMAEGKIYYAFILKNEIKTGDQTVINAGKLLAQLNLDPGLFLPGIEFGNEIWKGSGQIEIIRFAIAVNGNTL